MEDLKIKISTTADVAGANQAARAIEGVNKAAGNTAQQAAKATTANKGLLESFGDLGRRGSAAQDVVEGIGRAATGGAGSIFGLAKAVQNFLQIVRGGVAASGPIGLLVTVLGVAAGLFLTLKDKIFGAKEELEKTGKATDEFKTKLVELEAAAKKSLEAQLAEVKKLTAGYTELLDMMDEAQGRAKQLNESRAALARAQIDRDEAAALANAKTPEERERIAGDFSRRRATFDAQRTQDAFSEEEQFAKQRIRTAQDVLGKVRIQKGEAQAEVSASERAFGNSLSAAQIAAAEARDLSEKIGGSLIEDPEVTKRFAAAQELNKIAELDAAKLKAAKERQSKVEADLAETTSKATAELTKFGASIENIGLQRQTAAVQSETATLKASTAAKPQLEALQSEARAAAERGDFTAQDRATAKIRTLQTGLAPITTTGSATPPPSSRSIVAPEAAPIVAKIDQQTNFIRAGSEALLQAQARSASVQIDFQKRLKGQIEKQERQIRNARD